MSNERHACGPSWIDGHLDLALIGLGGRDFDQPPPATGAVSWPSLLESRIEVAFGTIFTEMNGPADQPASYPRGDRETASRVGRAQMAWYESMEKDGRIHIVRRMSDLQSGPGIGIVLLMECADPILDPEDLAWWLNQGLRMVGLSWAFGSRHAGGNAVPGGLTEEGRQLVEALEACGIGHDLSHLSREAFDDIIETTSGPICATHSNASAITGDDPRHLTDDQYGAIADRDGIVGLNLYGRFLAKGREATVEDCLDHVEHAAEILGRQRVSLGSDADGGFDAGQLPRGLRRLQDLPRLTEGLRGRGWSSAEIDGFQRDNWLRWLATLGSMQEGTGSKNS